MKDHIIGIFSRAAATYDTVGPQFFSRFGRRLVELADIPAGADVLDIAAGRGAILFPAAEAVGPNGSVTGIDLSAEMVRETSADIERRGLRNVRIMQMDAEQLRFPDASFDMVLCGFGLFFFLDLDHALAEFQRVLRPGGRLAATTWGDTDWKWFFDIAGRHLPPSPETSEAVKRLQRLDQAENVEAELRHAGFADVRVLRETQDFVYADDEAWWNSLWTHGLRGTLEQLDAETLTRFKADVLATAETMRQSDGLHDPLSALFAFGTKAPKL